MENIYTYEEQKIIDSIDEFQVSIDREESRKKNLPQRLKKRFGRYNQQMINKIVNNSLKNKSKLNNKDKEFKKFIEKNFTVYELGNYLTCIPVGSYPSKTIQYQPHSINKFDKTPIIDYIGYYPNEEKSRKSILETFKIMRKKYRYAYFIEEPLQVYFYSRENLTYQFENEEESYYRFVFTDFDFSYNQMGKIDLHPEIYKPDILKEVLEEMYAKGLDIDIYAGLLKNLKNYNFYRYINDVPKRVISQLEMRYLFHECEYNPYGTKKVRNSLIKNIPMLEKYEEKKLKYLEEQKRLKNSLPPELYLHRPFFYHESESVFEIPGLGVRDGSSFNLMIHKLNECNKDFNFDLSLLKLPIKYTKENNQYISNTIFDDEEGFYSPKKVQDAYWHQERNHLKKYLALKYFEYWYSDKIKEFKEKIFKVKDNGKVFPQDLPGGIIQYNYELCNFLLEYSFTLKKQNENPEHPDLFVFDIIKELSDIPSILKIPYKTYSKMTSYSPEYKKIFNELKLHYDSKWKIQQIMKSYLDITQSMIEPIDPFVVDFCELFIKTFNYSDSSTYLESYYVEQFKDCVFPIYEDAYIKMEDLIGGYSMEEGYENYEEFEDIPLLAKEEFIKDRLKEINNAIYQGTNRPRLRHFNVSTAKYEYYDYEEDDSGKSLM